MSKRKDVSLLVSAAGWIAGFVDQLIRALRERGISDEEIYHLVTEDGRAMVNKIADAFAEIIKQTKNVFHLKLDNPRIQRTTEEVVKAGKYDWANPDVNNHNFPIRPRPAGEKVIELVEFDYDPTSGQVLAEAEKRGLERPAYEDALAFGEQFPEKQRERPIVFLHEPRQGLHGDRRVLVLYGRGLERKLRLYSFVSKWDRNYLFAFVRK